MPCLPVNTQITAPNTYKIYQIKTQDNATKGRWYHLSSHNGSVMALAATNCNAWQLSRQTDIHWELIWELDWYLEECRVSIIWEDWETGPRSRTRGFIPIGFIDCQSNYNVSLFFSCQKNPKYVVVTTSQVSEIDFRRQMSFYHLHTRNWLQKSRSWAEQLSIFSTLRIGKILISRLNSKDTQDTRNIDIRLLCVSFR